MTAPVPTPHEDVARLTELLRGQRRPICQSCVAAKLGIDTLRLLDAITDVSRTVALDQEVTACSVCGRSQWALSLRT